MPAAPRDRGKHSVVNLDALADIFHGADPPIVFRPDTEPPEHTRALMDTLGVRIEVVPVPVRSSPRSAVNKQVRVGEGTGGQIVVLGAWCPTCKRESMPNRHGYCSFCGTRILDEDALSARAMRDQIEADKVRPVEESHAPEPLITAGVDDSDAPVDGTSTASRRWTRWTAETALERVRAVAEQLGRVPMQRESRAHALPSVSTARELFGSWGNMLVEAGYDRPRRGIKPPVLRRLDGASPSTPSLEAPKQEEAPAEITPYREEGAAGSTAAEAGASDTPHASPADTHVAQALILAARAFADTLERELLNQSIGRLVTKALA